MAKSRPAPNGSRSVYLEHGIFYDPRSKRIHVTADGLHLAYRQGTRAFAFYREVLKKHDRWPGNADQQSKAVDERHRQENTQ